MTPPHLVLLSVHQRTTPLAQRGSFAVAVPDLLQALTGMANSTKLLYDPIHALTGLEHGRGIAQTLNQAFQLEVKS
jgi:hypothetical protein